MERKSIVVLATLDTKGREAEYLRDQIQKLGYTTLLIDTGVMGTPGVKADITREEVAATGGIPLEKFLINPIREVVTPVMAEGATRIVQELIEKGAVHGIVSLGGTQGSSLSTQVM